MRVLCVCIYKYIYAYVYIYIHVHVYVYVYTLSRFGRIKYKSEHDPPRLVQCLAYSRSIIILSVLLPSPLRTGPGFLLGRKRDPHALRHTPVQQAECPAGAGASHWSWPRGGRGLQGSQGWLQQRPPQAAVGPPPEPSSPQNRGLSLLSW